MEERYKKGTGLKKENSVVVAWCVNTIFHGVARWCCEIIFFRARPDKETESCRYECREWKRCHHIWLLCG